MDLVRAGQCRCLICQRVLPLSDVCLVGFSNDIAASFCLDCFCEGRAFSVTRTHDGIAVQLTGGLPRVSGDGPPVLDALTGVAWAAPRERGWTVWVRRAVAGQPGCPA